MDKARGDLLLSPYRVLDLTDERGLLCGKILADLGADVVQIEPPGGSSARRIGPFYRDQVHPEKASSGGPMPPTKGPSRWTWVPTTAPRSSGGWRETPTSSSSPSRPVIWTVWGWATTTWPRSTQVS